MGLAKLSSNFTGQSRVFFFFFLLAGLAVDFLHRAVSESCLFFCKAKKLSGSDLFPCFYKLNDVGV